MTPFSKLLGLGRSSFLCVAALVLCLAQLVLNVAAQVAPKQFVLSHFWMGMPIPEFELPIAGADFAQFNRIDRKQAGKCVISTRPFFSPYDPQVTASITGWFLEDRLMMLVVDSGLVGAGAVEDGLRNVQGGANPWTAGPRQSFDFHQFSRGGVSMSIRLIRYAEERAEMQDTYRASGMSIDLCKR